MEFKPSDLKKIDDRASNIYEAIIAVGKKARQVNEEWRLEYNTMLNTMNPDGIEDEFDDKANSDKLEISKEFDKRKKPHLFALDKFMGEGVQYRYKEEAEEK
ncbi:MAG: DNA-directed RNA polymerase subunit omega [Rhodothermaceae bacterium]